MNYGLPYMGSKNRIAEWVVDILPASDTLYDLFAGGCAITHCAMLSGKWNNYVINDINSGITQLFIDAIDGKYKDENRWISREDFYKLKDDDPYVRCCWSFGNNNKTYMYNPQIEPYKKACHYAIVFDDWGQYAELCPETVDAAKKAVEGLTDIKERRFAFNPAVVRRLKELNDESLLNENPLYKSVKRKNSNETKTIDNLSHIQPLESQERLERLQSIYEVNPLYKGTKANDNLKEENLIRLRRINDISSTVKPTRLCIDYRDVGITPNSTVYCDIPYAEKFGYNKGFNHDEFYEWALSRPYDVYISEYSMPEGFTCIAEKSRLMSYNSKRSYNTIEKLFINR